MKLGDRIKWTSHREKVRTGTFITDMATKSGFVLVKGDDGKAHVMRKNKPQFMDRPGRGPERVATRGIR